MHNLTIVEWIIYPLKAELSLLFRLRSRWIQPILFFCLLVTLFPMGLGAGETAIPLLLPTLVWIAASLAALWSAESAFQMDLEERALEQVILSPYPMWLWLLIRGIAYWLVIGLPITVLAPLLAWLFGLSEAAAVILALSLLFGMPGLCMLALIASGLTLCLRNNGLLLILMMLPLFIPFLIFGVGAVNLSLMGMSALSQLAWVAALSMFVLTLGPFAGGLGIQYSLDD